MTDSDGNNLPPNENEESDNEEFSVDEYEQKFLKEYTQKEMQKYHIRRCPKCNYFMVSDDISEKVCPQCNTHMLFALFCTTCKTWYSVKTYKNYFCPTCGNLLIKKSKV
ncbi:MAG: zinc-ribbon domain-containing protein [Candidatus Lokiarchaeota archaeon]|nr:zinc-ribbon domain-containing protein [Candidatus Lokiarchaeota archaeon]